MSILPQLLLIWTRQSLQTLKLLIFNGATSSLNFVMHGLEVEGRVWKQARLLKGKVSAFFGALARM